VTPRQRIEAVLLKYNIVNCVLREDLLATCTESLPEREAIRHLLLTKWHFHRPFIIGVPGSIRIQEEFLNDLMTWAQGEPERVWCEHIRLETDGIRGCWYFAPSTSESAGMMQLPDTWTICPICGVKRPTETS